ncbi:MAG: helix-turn-helix transcriptional regulator [Halieaceae bacterium]|jgi:AraC-like DNA-binding protein|nr:helix-turn-helix transcriptional regulator [Halieaceae bacterium]
MATFLVAAIAFALSQWVLSMLLLWQNGQWGVGQRLFGLLQLAIGCYLVQPLVAYTSWGWTVIALSTAVPGMFWLFSASVFDDHFRLKPWQVLLVAITVVLPAAGTILNQFEIMGLDWLLFSLPQGLEFVLLGLTAWEAFKHWQMDLIQARRRLRFWFVAINGVYIFALILFREVMFANQGWLSSWQYLPVGGMLLAMNALLLQYKRDVLWSPLPNSTVSVYPDAEPAVDEALVRSLRSMMIEESMYREMGLTIGQLAGRLELPEYRLRQAINQGLGYRNFADFLNSYRIEETVQRLADPGQDGLPILTIAMNAGFRSLSSFNRAFRQARNMTPTAYRKKHAK